MAGWSVQTVRFPALMCGIDSALCSGMARASEDIAEVERLAAAGQARRFVFGKMASLPNRSEPSMRNVRSEGTYRIEFSGKE